MASAIKAVANIDGVDKVIVSIEKMSIKGKKKLTLNIGYEADYAIYVHENLNARHINGRAKFLEKPARMLSKKISDMVKDTLQRKRGLEEGLMKSGNMLLDASKKEVPVDTGNLRDSGFVKVVSE